MPKRTSDFKKIIDESAFLINKLKAYEERIKELDKSVLFLKEKSTIGKIKKQLNNKDSIIKELAEAKQQMNQENKEKNKLINNLRTQLKALDLEIDKKDSGMFILNKELERQNQIINEKDIRIKQLAINLQSFKQEFSKNKNLILQLKQELDDKTTSLAKFNESLTKDTEQIKKLNSNIAILKNKLKEKDKSMLLFKEKSRIFDTVNKEIIIKDNQMRDEILALNQKILEKNKLIQELSNELSEKDDYYPVLIEQGKERNKKKLEQTLKQNTRTELELKTRIKELELQLKKQKEQLLSKGQKEKELIEDIRSKLLEMGEFKEKKKK